MDRSQTSTNVFCRIAAQAGLNNFKGLRILDLGCGDGGMLRELTDMGCDAWGCDFEPEIKNPQPNCRIIDPSPYHLPFDSAFFDVVISNQVFEHVQNPDETCREIARILKPDGTSIHVFPSRWRLFEPHVHVPLASWFRPRWWLKLWAMFGIRNEFQIGKSPEEVTQLNLLFLTESTRYLSKSAIRKTFSRTFREVKFVESGLFNTSSHLPRLCRPLLAPICGFLYSGFMQRIVLALK